MGMGLKALFLPKKDERPMRNEIIGEIGDKYIVRNKATGKYLNVDKAGVDMLTPELTLDYECKKRLSGN